MLPRGPAPARVSPAAWNPRCAGDMGARNSPQGRAPVKPLHLVWFLSGYQPRGWLDPRWGTGYDYRDPELYMDCARMLERGCFDGILIADQPSIDDTYTGNIGAS